MGSESRPTGVAIVGSRAAPRAENAAAFWRNLCDGVEFISALSDEEILAAGVPEALLGDPLREGRAAPARL